MERNFERQMTIQRTWVEDISKRVNPFNEREIGFLKSLHSKTWKDLMSQMESFKSEMTSLRNLSKRKLSADSDSASSLGSDSFSSQSSQPEKRKQLGFTEEGELDNKNVKKQPSSRLTIPQEF